MRPPSVPAINMGALLGFLTWLYMLKLPLVHVSISVCPLDSQCIVMFSDSYPQLYVYTTKLKEKVGL